jgi:hypothetical protein
MSRSPTGHGFWMPASIAGDTWPGVLATTLRSERTSGLHVPRRRELGLHENVLLRWRDILMVSTRCAEALVFSQSGPESLFGREKRLPRKADDESFKTALFCIASRAAFSFRVQSDDLAHGRFAGNSPREGHPACTSVIREAIRKAGYRCRSAKVVLTSNDPNYREKLDRVHRILRGLGKNERFFSIDEFGPFAIKAKPGRVLAEPGSSPSVPQWQKSRGWLIVTAALELPTNQVTHFYSRSKNTHEMIRMTQVLLDEYKSMDILYLSWDADSWHMSRSCSNC